MITRRLRTLLAICVSTASSAAAREPATSQRAPRFDAIDSYLRDQMAARRLPGLAVAVVEGERVVLLRGYGSAADERPVTPQTPFYIGSCTKGFTALAVMQLVAEGKLELDAPVRRYLPWFRVAAEDASGRITVRHLLNQTSGLGEGGDPRPNDRHSSLADSARALSAVRPTAVPGGQFQYYNQNYRLLGALIEAVSGVSYADYLSSHVFTPLGMSQTTANPGAAHGVARGHRWVFGFALPRQQGWDPGALSSGYIISTAEDLSHYLAALLNDGRYEQAALLPPLATRQLFEHPQGVTGAPAPPSAVAQLLGSSSGIETGYAMGWLVAQAPQARRLVFHAGTLENFRADILLVPEERRGLALLVNLNGVLQPLFEPEPLWTGVARLLVGSRPQPAPSVRWRVALFVLIVAADLALGIFRLARLRRWREKARRRSALRRWTFAAVDVIIPAAFLVAIPAFLTAVAKVSVTWLGFLDFIPDVAAWLFVSLVLSLTRGLCRVVMLSRGL